MFLEVFEIEYSRSILGMNGGYQIIKEVLRQRTGVKTVTACIVDPGWLSYMKRIVENSFTERKY